MTDVIVVASPDRLVARARLYQYIRQFFLSRNILEVETPLLREYTVPDLHIHSLKAGNYYLQTSPEYAMKQLLLEGSGSIYQICKAFRSGEVGKRHQPEFSLLEWYVLDVNDQQLMDQVQELLIPLFAVGQFERVSYGQLFQQYFSFDPHQASLADCIEVLKALHPALYADLQESLSSKTLVLELLFSHSIEPEFADAVPVFVYDWPEEQAALARVEKDHDNNTVAKRFELYFRGFELCNGYYECNDSAAIQKRYDNALLLRKQADLPLPALDRAFIDAQDRLPDCSGVALGLDRVLMLLQGEQDIARVMAIAF